MTKRSVLHLLAVSVLACLAAGCASEAAESDESAESGEGNEEVGVTADAYMKSGSWVSVGGGCRVQPRWELNTSTNYFKAVFGMSCDPDRTAQFSVCIDRYTSSGWGSISCNGFTTKLVGDGLLIHPTQLNTGRSVTGVANGTYRGRLNFWTSATGWTSARTPTIYL